MSDSSEPQITFIAPEPSALAPFFPGYEITGLIATGGMGAVYRAIQKSLDRPVAIKILPQEFSKDAAFCAGFEAEAKAMARLNHPNLIGVYDFGEVNGMLYIIMEYVPGKSLFHSAHGLAIDPGEVIRLVAGICHGLAHAHANGIIHRDIKPSNILLDLNAQPKIGDFGLARPVEQQAGEGEDIFGTPHYTAPEVCNSPNSVDYRADIFSVGVLLHELLTSRLPEDDPRPASVIIACDPRFDAIIRRATDPVAKLRYASAEEIANDLCAIAASTGPQGFRAPVGSAPPRAVAARTQPDPPQPKPSSGFSGIFLLMAILAIAAATYHYSKQPAKPRDIPPVQSDPATPNAAPAPPPAPPADAPPSGPTAPPPAATETAPPTIEAPPAAMAETPPAGTEIPPAAMAETPPTEPTTETAPVAQPKFDVNGFFTRALKIMQDRAAPQVAKYNTNIKDNFWSFEQMLIRSASTQQSKAQITKAMATLRTQGGRVPATLASALAEIPGASTAYAQSLDKQKSFDSAIQRELAQLAPTYILGLKKQIERLQAENDPAAIALIEEEIAKTGDDPLYFTTLMLGFDPSSEDSSTDSEDLSPEERRKKRFEVWRKNHQKR